MNALQIFTEYRKHYQYIIFGKLMWKCLPYDPEGTPLYTSIAGVDFIPPDSIITPVNTDIYHNWKIAPVWDLTENATKDDFYFW